MNEARCSKALKVHVELFETREDAFVALELADEPLRRFNG